MLTAGLVGGGIGLLSGLLGAGLTAGSGLLAGMYGANASERSNDLNRDEARRQFDANMAWQREQFNRMIDLSNTAHQREVQDLRAAGLNPILSATGGSGASTVGAVGSPSPTAHMSDLDLSGSMKLIADGISDASDQALKAADLHSMIGLRQAQGAEALSRASQNKELTGPMKTELLARANSAAASANFHNILAVQADTLTPLQASLLRAQTAKEQQAALGLRRENAWIDKRNQWKLMTEAAKRDFMAGQLRVNQVNAARGIYNSVRDTFKPRFHLENIPGSDYIGDLIFNK